MNRFDLLHTPLAGRNLIEASAGTGKTFTIAGVYLRLVLELRLAVAQILVVTFTEAATKELKERIRKRLREAESAFERGESPDHLLSGLLQQIPDHLEARRLLSLAVRSFDEAAIFTIHGFCQRMLQENPFESGSLCDTELMTDQGMILREIAQDYWRINCYDAPREKIAAANTAGISAGSLLGMARRIAGDPFAAVLPDALLKSEATEDWLLCLKRGFFDYLNAELPKRKRLKNVRSFDDLLLDLHTALRREESALPRLIRERYQAALIDEFQDTDPIQFAIFDAIYPVGQPAPFFLIGDPKQAIYSFRGADIFAYIGAARATRQRHTLLQNWRSEPNLIKAVNSIFASNELPFLFEEISFSAVEPAQTERKLLTAEGESAAPLKLWFTPRKEAGKPINKGDAWEMLPEAVASEISRLLRKGADGEVKIGERGVAPGDIAVLVRANRQAKLMQRALTRRGIPSVLCSAGNLFESDEAAELLRILSAAAEPGHEALLRGALATDLAGVCGDELARLMGDESGWERVLEEFRSYHEIWSASGCMAMTLQFMERRQVRERLLSAPMGERRLTNLLHAVETIHQAQVEGHLGMEGVIAWLACRITEEPKREEHEIRLETDEAAVQLVTIHKSKGLEYPIVFLPFCWAEFGGRDETALFHDADGRVVLDIGSAQLAGHKALAQRESLAESLRLLYVALTRGKHRTYLIWGAFKDAGDCALHYLLHPDAQGARGQVALSDEAMLAELAHLADSSDGSIEVIRMPAADRESYLPQASDSASFSFRRFSGSIARDWRVASFTSLATRHHQAAELPDRDEGSFSEAQPAKGVDPSGIFAFPRGAKAGIFLHEIFERLDFTGSPDLLKPLVTELLDRHGFPAEWCATVCAMVHNVLHAPLGAERFTLARIGMERRFTELEFFFPLASVTSERLRETVSRFSDRSRPERGSDLLFDTFPVNMAGLFSRLSFAPVQGMLRGFIDLVVEHGGRYFILDWKSNHLGNRVEDYDQPGMRREMEQSLYPLQYLLYTVALDNYLRLRIPDYDYDRHFGGVFYLFLRGVNRKGNGVFADRPPKSFIAELSDALLGAGSV
ncbi:MAG: exodeoxyribonuclease V subunit beta [Geobacteraceae bacterium GWC2_58_44]|nr:MAG: exodeoxyribonuclease V subunit beta [Geobacteraceae bacterium GWC2_58_44]HBG08076.1 exodeoxyribonuclease V subunit beta [Geobacter sp.]